VVKTTVGLKVGTVKKTTRWLIGRNNVYKIFKKNGKKRDHNREGFLFGILFLWLVILVILFLTITTPLFVEKKIFGDRERKR